ncbi:hypothetical protein M3661_05490 [Paenibacillus sp. MER 180]|uniref:Lipoprotein n=1 Tax=Paenibacillus alvei TaxID=44250 RepID=A0ABT4EJQ0_PAEAL|nr:MULTISPECIES: hypothetical protein [Paenibacillus]EPY14054.1 hypothetical protein PAAL66ix_05164 [Paenibacillus alvei A6-6i-x]MCM3289578.1 hypothetical protein [Paenibacillus sp. MER 180]MCY9532668.1 hypothetical protein [Paenibacillus alvei]OBY80126.1 hypothetical protein BBG47_07560 [Paenibacillus sp. KS1]SDE65286.1 hypothetical protein SAMN04488689_102100 [Paenibacillus sp. cl6col]
MKHSKRFILLCVVFIAMTILLSGCMPGDGSYTDQSPAGFFWGIWHGWIAPISLIFGLFKDGIRVYEINNTGWWYDLGFYLAIVGGFGGFAFSRRKGDHH